MRKVISNGLGNDTQNANDYWLFQTNSNSKLSGFSFYNMFEQFKCKVNVRFPE
jgi:predicted chitinase